MTEDTVVVVDLGGVLAEVLALGVEWATVVVVVVEEGLVVVRAQAREVKGTAQVLALGVEWAMVVVVEGLVMVGAPAREVKGMAQEVVMVAAAVVVGLVVDGAMMDLELDLDQKGVKAEVVALGLGAVVVEEVDLAQAWAPVMVEVMVGEPTLVLLEQTN